MKVKWCKIFYVIHSSVYGENRDVWVNEFFKVKGFFLSIEYLFSFNVKSSMWL